MFSNLSINWFDFVIVLTVLIGVKLGSKRGMSKEFLRFLQWTFIVAAAGILYPALGELISNFGGLGPTLANLTAYLLIAGVVKLFFIYLNNRVGEKIESRHIFGSFEYYLGPLAGGVRFACVVLVLLALLHIEKVPEAERQREIKYQIDNYGAVYFPTLGLVNNEIFGKSMAGRWIDQNLNFLLLPPSNTVGKSARL